FVLVLGKTRIFDTAGALLLCKNLYIENNENFLLISKDKKIFDYAKPIVSKGLTFMNTPGNDIEQLSAMVAGGANICVFTTGRG
ncbi:hypothetical protein VWN77_10915, partial [Campylobacter coli]